MLNEITFIIHSMLVGLFAIGCIRLGRGALTGFMSVCWVLGNLFVIKQATIFGLDVITADPFAIGANLSIVLASQYYGEKAANNCVWIGFYTAFFFLIMSQIHLIYIPNIHDTTHAHFVPLLGRMARIILTSFAVSAVSIKLNLYLFDKLKFYLKNYFELNAFISLSLSQIVDTILFAFIALYGQVHSVWEIIIFSCIIKIITIAISLPSISITKRFITQHDSL